MKENTSKTGIPLSKLPAGIKCRIINLRGGHRFIERVNNLGILPGKEIIKVSEQPLNGPVVIRCGNTELAIGRGMAEKIFVETEEKD